MKYDLTVVLPSIRKERLPAFWESLLWAVGPKYRCQLIIVSPYDLPEQLLGIPNISILQDFGSPARCIQMGALLAEGKYITWSSDDGLYYENSLEKCIDLLEQESVLNSLHAVIVRYSEGVGRTGQEPPDNYWVGSTHPDMQLPTIDPNWNIAPVGMYHTDMFYDFGGLDCRFEHANMNSHDLAFRFQMAGGKFHKSPTVVMGCDQMPGWSGDHGHIEDAYWKNDKGLFAEVWSKPREMQISYDNWKNAESVWRRFK
jgi:hypothetical protein